MSTLIEDGLTLSELAAAVGGRCRGADRRFCGVSTDTRTLRAGDLFIALRGPRFDAHDFLEEARTGGAVGALIDRPVDTELPAVCVDDTRAALGRLAAHWRGRFDIPVIGVTGSNGKTTVKEMLGAILAQRGAALVTQGNLNNDIGVPLTLLGLGRGHRHAVIEMGAGRPGDIDRLSRIAHPAVAVITNAAPAHLAGFGDVTGVARAKGEIFNGLDEDGTAVINIDDPHAGLWRALAGRRRIITFGLGRHAEVRASALRVNEPPGCAFTLHTPAGDAEVRLGLAGRHNVMNALAAAAAAGAVGMTLAEIVRGLESVQPVPHRLQLRRGIGGARLIDDTYNANPASVSAALEVLAAATGLKLLVLGDMGELGDGARALHEQIGRQARDAGIDRLYALGELARSAATAFGEGARHFSASGALSDALRAELAGAVPGAPPVTVLVKGSRSMRMEQVADALASGDGAADGAIGGSPDGSVLRDRRVGG